MIEYHIYGSSRLGIQRYISGQKGFDAVNTNTAGGATQALAQQRAWYSLWGGDLFAIPTYNPITGQSPSLGTGAMGYDGIGI